jgi:hypothetical protein
MPSPWHDALRNLITSDPGVTLELLRDAGVDTPDGLPLTAGPYSVSDRVSNDLYPDNTVTVGPEHDRTCTVIVEIESKLSADALRQYVFKATAVTLETRRNVHVLVFTRDPDADAWREPVTVDRGSLTQTLTPVIYGRRDMPRLTDLEKIAADPAAGVLSVFGHGDDWHVAEAFAAAVKSFPEEQGVRYIEWAYDCGPELFRRIMEEKMATTDWPVSTPFAKHHYGRGLAEGEASAILTVLTTRGIAVPDHHAAAIRACTDLDQLQQWLTKAVTATTIDDLNIE